LQVVLQNLLGSHRLCLVLDLDHTLVNSAKFSEVDADWEYRLEQLAAEQVGGQGDGMISLEANELSDYLRSTTLQLDLPTA
jgi:hypothetical protein